MSNLPHDHRDRDLHSADGSPSAQDLAVESDRVELHVDASVGAHSNLAPRVPRPLTVRKLDTSPDRR